MRIIDKEMTDWEILCRHSEKDSEGNPVARWIPGERFRAAAVFEATKEFKAGLSQGAKGAYRVYVPLPVEICYHDVFRRLSDGKTLRSVSDSADNKAPAISTIKYRSFYAQEFEPEGEIYG